MSQRITTRDLLSKEKKVNKFFWLSTVEMVDEYIERGHGYEDVSLETGHYSIDQLAGHLKEYSEQYSFLGPLEINIYEDRCGEGIHYSIYHKKPYTQEELVELRERRQEILDSKDNSAIDLIRRYRKLCSERPEWVDDQHVKITEEERGQR